MDSRQQLANSLRADLQRLIIEHNDLSGYFFRSDMAPPGSIKSLNPTPFQERTKVYALCDLMLCHFSAIIALAEKAGNSPQSFWSPHVAYIKFICSRSQVLKARYLKRRELYGESLIPYFGEE